MLLTILASTFLGGLLINNLYIGARDQDTRTKRAAAKVEHHYRMASSEGRQLTAAEQADVAKTAAEAGPGVSAQAVASQAASQAAPTRSFGAGTTYVQTSEGLKKVDPAGAPPASGSPPQAQNYEIQMQGQTVQTVRTASPQFSQQKLQEAQKRYEEQQRQKTKQQQEIIKSLAERQNRTAVFEDNKVTFIEKQAIQEQKYNEEQIRQPTYKTPQGMMRAEKVPLYKKPLRKIQELKYQQQRRRLKPTTGVLVGTSLAIGAYGKGFVKGITAPFRPAFYKEELPSMFKTIVKPRESLAGVGTAIRQDPTLLFETAGYMKGFGKLTKISTAKLIKPNVKGAAISKYKPSKTIIKPTKKQVEPQVTATAFKDFEVPRGIPKSEVMKPKKPVSVQKTTTPEPTSQKVIIRQLSTRKGKIEGDKFSKVGEIFSGRKSRQVLLYETKQVPAQTVITYPSMARLRLVSLGRLVTPKLITLGQLSSLNVARGLGISQKPMITTTPLQTQISKQSLLKDTVNIQQITQNQAKLQKLEQSQLSKQVQQQTQIQKQAQTQMLRQSLDTRQVARTTLTKPIPITSFPFDFPARVRGGLGVTTTPNVFRTSYAPTLVGIDFLPRVSATRGLGQQIYSSFAPRPLAVKGKKRRKK